MPEPHFERYREALRTGHAALEQGRLEDALAAYSEAVGLAADRAVPRTALGGVHLRRGDPGAALEAYESALALVPDDPAAQAGRARALEALGREDEVPAPAADSAPATPGAAPATPGEATPGTGEDAHGTAAIAWPQPAGEPAGDTPSLIDEAEPSDAEAEAAPTPPDPEDLVAAAEEAIQRGDAAAVAAATLAAARAHALAGHTVAAIDACLLGIGARPADIDLHLALADLGRAAGPLDRAAEARRRLLRLAELDGDAASIARVRDAIVAADQHLVDRPPAP